MTLLHIVTIVIVGAMFKTQKVLKWVYTVLIKDSMQKSMHMQLIHIGISYCMLTQTLHKNWSLRKVKNWLSCIRLQAGHKNQIAIVTTLTHQTIHFTNKYQLHIDW